MASFPAIYRARAVQVNGLLMQAFVPQVFGEQQIAIDTFLGGAPTQPGMGWVMFQGGNPEFPVWAGNLASGSGAGGADEVWIGEAEPSDPGLELWYDPDAIPPPLGPLPYDDFPNPVGPFNDPGTSPEFARGDHVHSAHAGLIASTAFPTPSGGSISATNVQAALEEIAAECSPVATGTLGVVARRTSFASAFSTTASAADISSSSGPAPAINMALNPARLYRFTFNTNAICTGAVGDRLVLELSYGTTPGITIVRSFVFSFPAINQGLGISVQWLFYPSNNTVQNWRVRARHQGTGPIAMSTVSGTNTMDFMIEDIGLAM